MKVSNLVQAKTRKGSSFDLGHISTLSVRHAVTAAVSRQRRVPLATEPAENMHRCHISDSYPQPPPFSVYVLIILLLLLLFVVHQFAGLCSQQKQMGNICPGRPGPPPPGLPSRERPPAASARPPGAAGLLLYSDTPLFCDCSTQQGPRGPPPALGGRGQWGGERRRGGRRGLQGSRAAGPVARQVFLPNPAQASPTGAPVLCRAREFYYW